MQAAEQVGGRLANPVQSPQELFGFCWRPAVTLVIFSEHGEDLWVGLKLAIPGRTEEGRAIAAVVQPGLLLPTGKAGSASGDLFYDRQRHLVGHVNGIAEHRSHVGFLIASSRNAQGT
nr:hypothetical protein [Streptomyces sp.]